MDADRRRALIVTAIVLLVLIALIVGIVWYLIQFIRSRQTSLPTVSRTPAPTTTSVPLASPESFPVTGGVTSTPTPVPVVSPNVQTSPTKTYNGQGFQLVYPREWGLLTCTNSQNIEFDPANSTDQKISCDRAIKPITVLVNSSNCPGGQTVNLGGVQAVKVVTQVQGGVNYKWCVRTGIPLEISHRVSPQGGRASSVDDFSAQIEQMIANFRFGISS